MLIRRNVPKEVIKIATFLPEGSNTFKCKINIWHNSLVILFSLQKLRETGVMEKLHQDTMGYRPRTDERAVKSVELLDVVPMLSILASGILVAVILVFLERFVT
jgi:hypothetical protein